ncbi:MAG: NAD(P)-dependent oxidoreductase, partial [Chloroflexota bacterium]
MSARIWAGFTHYKSKESTMRVGVIGTGNMGGPIAVNLLKAGHEVFVHDKRRVATQAPERAGAQLCGNPQEVAEACRLVMTSLPGPKEVVEVALSKKGIFAGAQKGDIFIDLSTNGVSVIRRIAEIGRQKGIFVLDAPLVGGTWGAKSATLTIMVGGDKEALEKSRPVLQAIGTKIVHVGTVGNGNVAKLINNMLTQVHLHSIAEAMALGAKAGIDLQKLYDILSDGTATSP